METKGYLTSAGIDCDTDKLLVEFMLDGNAMKLYDDFHKMDGDTLFDLKITKHREKRSKDANAYYWGLVGQLADKLGISTARLHNQLLARYGQLEFFEGKIVELDIPETEDAEEKALEATEYHIKPTADVQLRYDVEKNEGYLVRIWLLLRGSHTYNSKEMATLISGLCEECKDQGIETLTPAELERICAEWKRS